jgi:hypothetical protein
MRAAFNRRTTTKVKDGRVQKKNRRTPTVHQGYVIDRESPGRGFHHVVSKRDVQAFTEIISGWQQFSHRLERIVLAHCAGYDGQYVFHRREETGSIYLSAWTDDLWVELRNDYFNQHREIFDRLGVQRDQLKENVLCRFTENQARAFMLLHVFLHELGHHYDKLHQKHHGSARGEDYAEKFATSRFNQLWPEYVRVFGDPAKETA